MATWQLQTAKAKLSELLRKVREEGPQIITVRGKEEYVVTRKEDAPAQAGRTPPTSGPKTLWELFEPLRESGAGDALAEALEGVREERGRYDHDD